MLLSFKALIELIILYYFFISVVLFSAGLLFFFAAFVLRTLFLNNFVLLCLYIQYINTSMFEVKTQALSNQQYSQIIAQKGPKRRVIKSRFQSAILNHEGNQNQISFPILEPELQRQKLPNKNGEETIKHHKMEMGKLILQMQVNKKCQTLLISSCKSKTSVVIFI